MAAIPYVYTMTDTEILDILLSEDNVIVFDYDFSRLHGMLIRLGFSLCKKQKGIVFEYPLNENKKLLLSFKESSLFSNKLEFIIKSKSYEYIEKTDELYTNSISFNNDGEVILITYFKNLIQIFLEINTLSDKKYTKEIQSYSNKLIKTTIINYDNPITINTVKFYGTTYSNPFDYEKIIQYIPRVRKFNLEQLSFMEEHLSTDELTLLEMIFI